MGKILIIKNADFSQVAIDKITPPEPEIVTTTTTNAELLTNLSYYEIVEGNTLLNKTSENNYWYSIIIPVHKNMYIEYIIGTYRHSTKIPPIIYLSSDNISNYIQGSEVYGSIMLSTNSFAGFSGYLNPPDNATHVIIQTNEHVETSNMNAIISWEDSN